MARPKGSKNKPDEVSKECLTNELKKYLPDEDINEKIVDEVIADNGKSESETISVFEAAERFKTSEATIKVWIDHGHLTGSNGRVHTRSIRECRFNTRRMI